jgi:tRNA 2-thiouridine synthesizing protein A
MVRMSTHELDARWLLCPLPVIRVQQKMKTLVKGDILVATCTDPGALHDIPAWCRIHGHPVLETRQQNNEVVVVLQVG